MNIETQEEFNVVKEIQKQKEIIGLMLGITENILTTLRGNVPRDDEECIKEECLLDTLKINKNNLIKLNKNIEEMMRKVTG